jgi:hypothetical protein
MSRSLYSFVLAISLACAAAQVHSDDIPSQTKHQRMKECMAKQKASDGGMPKEQMKKNCKDVTKTESENAKAEKGDTDQSTDAPRNQGSSRPLAR